MSNNTGLRRTSSLVFDSSTRSLVPQGRGSHNIGNNRQIKRTETIVIPDSEEERDRAHNTSARSPARRTEYTSIDSSEEEEDPHENYPVDDPFREDLLLAPTAPRPILKTVARINDNINDEDTSDEESFKLNKLKTPGRAAWSRRVVVSDSEESSNDEFEQEEKNDDDGAILVLNDPPPRARKPVAKPELVPTKTPSRAMLPGVSSDVQETPGGSRFLISDRTPLQTPVLAFGGPNQAPGYFDSGPFTGVKGGGKKKKTQIDGPLTDNTATPVTRGEPSKSGTPAKKGGRVSKKAQEAARQEQLQSYARQLFADLNRVVFDNGLPPTTELKWNKRLQTTAGKATWRSSVREGTETTSIELAVKVLDSEERIRNTLSHEMCHLASWVIDREPNEKHGHLFWKWSRKVMEKRPEIKISDKHSYDIAYKYEWQCQTASCRHIYGRHSKSIDHTKSSCGLCKGDLLPLFETRPRKTKADGRQEADKKRDSPTILEKFLTRSIPVANPSRLREAGIVINLSDEDTESGAEDVIEIPPTQKGKGEPNGSPSKPSGSRKGPSVGTADRAVNGLIKHLSIIDLTED